MTDRLTVEWSKSNFPTPQAYYAVFNGKYYVTISDNESVFRFASSKNQVYAAVKSNCVKQFDKVVNTNVYMIDNTNPFALQVISCRLPPGDADRFVVKTIIPLVFPSK